MAYDSKVDCWHQALLAKIGKWNEGCRGRIRCSNSDNLSAKISGPMNRRISTSHDQRCQVAVRIAHRNSADADLPDASHPSGTNPCQRRVPGDLYRPVKQRLYLTLVVGIKYVVEAQALLLEVTLEAFPNSNNLRIVRDCS